MADKPTLTAPTLSVVMADGAAWEVQSDNRDLVAFEREAARRSWPSPKDAPFGWLTYLAWHAARREGLIVGDVSLQAFTETALEVGNVKDEDDEDVELSRSLPARVPVPADL